MTSPTLAVANYFVGKSLDSGESLTPMKLIKLAYIAHGWHLAIKDEPLIDEAVEAWKFGPVVPSVYSRFRSYRDSQITKMAEMYSSGNVFVPMVQDTETMGFLDKVWSAYSKYDGWQLSAITHKDGTPWHKIWREEGGANKYAACIPNEIIQTHYKMLLDSRRNTN